ncbi:unnamed protein product, partial [Polarella glacialis]
VNPSVRMMLLQGQLMSSSAPQASTVNSVERPIEAEPQRDKASLSGRGLKAVLRSLDMDSEDDPRALLRRAASSRQFGEGVEEELRLATAALHACRDGRAPSRPSTPGREFSGGSSSSSSPSPVWEVSSLCAVAEAHLGIENSREALEPATEALESSRRSGESLSVAESL